MQKLMGSIYFVTEMKDIIGAWVKRHYTSREAKTIAEFYQAKYCEHAVRDSVVGKSSILWTGRCGVRISERGKTSVLCNVQSCSGAGPASSSMSIGVKWPGSHVGSPHLSSVEVKRGLNYGCPIHTCLKSIDKDDLLHIIIIIIIIIIRYGCLLSQAFSFWYFSWTSGDPQRSGFKLHTAVLSVLCVMFQV